MGDGAATAAPNAGAGLRVAHPETRRVTKHARELQKCSSHAGLRVAHTERPEVIKTEYLKFRASPDEVKEIDRICATLRLSRTEYLRAVAFGAPAPMSPHRVDTETPLAPDLGPLAERLAILESQQREANMALAHSAESFNALLANLNEFLRIPSFREYRARDLAIGSTQKKDEPEFDYLLRLAHNYWGQYQVWPDPGEKATFGPAAKADLTTFPNIKPI